MPRINFDRIASQDFRPVIGSEWFSPAFSAASQASADTGRNAADDASMPRPHPMAEWTATQLFHSLVNAFGHLHKDLLAAGRGPAAAVSGPAPASPRKTKKRKRQHEYEDDATAAAAAAAADADFKRPCGQSGTPLTGRRRDEALKYLDEVLYTKGTLDDQDEGMPEAADTGKSSRKRLLEFEQSPVYRDLQKRRKVSFKSLVDDVSVSLEQADQEHRRQLVVPKTFELFENEFYRNSMGRGDECLAMLRKTLDEFGFVRHSNQLYFHEEMLKACLRKIYQFDFEQNIDRVLKENGWAKMVQEVLVITARRIGKTVAVAMFAAALVICVPKIELMIFSVSLNSSRKMLQMLKDMVDAHPLGCKMSKEVNNKDKFWLVAGENDRRMTESRPGRGTSSRGFNAHVIIIDEAAFISFDLMMDTIVPVMGQTETSLLAISTALDDSNHYSALTKLVDKENNEPLFNVIRVGQVCEACQKTSTPWLCNHMAFDIPPWKSVKKQKRMEYIYEGQQYRNLRENFGQIAGSGRQAFNQTLIDQFKKMPPVRIISKPYVVFLGADPGGGGPSDLAMTAMVRKDGLWTIIALVASTVRGGALEEKMLITSTIDLILKQPEYADAIIVFIPENAPAIAASHLHSYILDRPRVCTLCEAPGGRPGVPKTNNSTRDMQYVFERELTMNNLRYAKKLLTIRSTPDEMKKKLEDQMASYSWDELPRSNEHADQRFKLHGKIAGANDDLLISCIMIPFWSQVFYSSSNPDYASYRYYALHGNFKADAPVRNSIVAERYISPAQGY